MVIDHLARIGMDGEIREADVRALCALAGHPRVYVKVSAFYALGARRPPYRDLAPLVHRVYDAFGARRLLWGSDAPFQLRGGHTYARSLEFAREGLGFLSAEGRAWLLGGTAEALFFAPLPREEER